MPLFFWGPSLIGPAGGHSNKDVVRKDYVVATAHLDTNWLWPVQDTIEQHIPKTLRMNFALFNKYPDYVFNFEGAVRYMFMKEYWPDQYQELKKWIAAGRWKVAGSAIVAGDTNIPSPESLIRQTLYANHFWKQEFGQTSDDLFLPDCFGFGYAYPSIAHHLGLIGFSTQKLYWGSSVGIPFPVGNWIGVDGHSMVAALDPGSYGTSLKEGFQNDPHLMQQINETGDKSGAYVAYRYHGTGDTGGAPEESSVKAMEDAIKAGGPITVLSAASDQLYRDLSSDQLAKLPSYNGELLLTTHGTGCYTGEAAMKSFNQQNENLADDSERVASMADAYGLEAYPTATLNEAWIRFLWHQFHDDLTGTSIPQVYQNSWNDETYSLNQFAQVETDGLTAMAAQMNTSGSGAPIVVYNSVSRDREGVVDARVQIPSNWRSVRVYDARGKEVPSQIAERSEGSVRILFDAKAPATGLAVFYARESSSPCTIGTGLSATASELKSHRYDVKVNSDGDISSIFDKVAGHELLSQPIRLTLRDNLSKDWPGWEIKYPVEMSKPRSVVAGPAVVRVVEAGPVRVSVEVVRTVDGSTFTQRIQLTNDGDRIDVPTTVDWHTKGTLLKVSFRTPFSAPSATYDLGLGTIDRGTDTEKKYEVPAQKWADMSDPTAGYGLSVMSTSKHGWDHPDANTLRLSLIHTPDPGDPNQYQANNDLGLHHFTYSLAGHKGPWQTETEMDAISLNHPLAAVQTTSHMGPLGGSFSFVKSNDPGVEVVAVKKAEDGPGLIVRVFEKYGKAHKSASLQFSSAIASATEVNGQETEIASTDLKTGSKSLTFGLTPYEPRAFLVEFKNKPEGSASLVPLPLTYNASVVGTEGQPIPAGLPYAIPDSLWPKTNVGGHDAWPPLGAMNAMTCAGQTIQPPKGARAVSLVVVNVGPEKDEAFEDALGSVSMMIPNSFDRIAQWTNRLVNDVEVKDQAEFGKPFMYKTPIAWVASHRLKPDGSVDTYKYVTCFRVLIGGDSTITLPNDEHLMVIAATADMGTAPLAKMATSQYHLP